MTRLNDTVKLAFLALFMGAFGAVIGTGITSMVSAHGGDESLVHACVRDLPPATGPLSSLFNTLLRNGDVRVVDADEECHTGEVALDWPKTGDGGLTDYEIVINDIDNPGAFVPGGSLSDHADCPDGKLAIGGGADASLPFALSSSYPDAGSWRAQAWNASDSDAAVHLVIYAICATVPQ